MIKNILLYLAGCLSGAAIFGFILMERQIGVGMSQWGETRVFSDGEVRKAIAEAHIVLPEGSHDLHYAIDGFQDHYVWIKFTVPEGKVWEVVKGNIKKNREDFTEVFSRNLPEEVSQHREQHLDLSWWNPRKVSRPRSWSYTEERGGIHNFEEWLVDEDNGVIYVWTGNA